MPLSPLLHSHEVNQAFFTIKKQGSHIVVETEFPWTLRNALIAFNPGLKTATAKADFENTFVRYIKTNLVLIDADGRVLPFKGFKEVDRQRHLHQNNYVLTFQGHSLASITNTMMFNVYDNQVNYTRVHLGNEQKAYKTRKGKSNININEEKNDNSVGHLGLVMLSIIAISVVMIRKESTTMG